MFSKPEYNSRGADDVIVFISMRFHLYPLSRAFPNRCGFDEYVQRFILDRNICVFKRKRISVDRVLVNFIGPVYDVADVAPSCFGLGSIVSVVYFIMPIVFSTNQSL